MHEYTFDVGSPKKSRTGWHVSVLSIRLKVHGPFTSYRSAVHFRDGLERRWRRRAESLGGELVCNGQEWVVRLPAGTPVDGLRRVHHKDVPSKGHDPRDDPPLKLRGGPWKIR